MVDPAIPAHPRVCVCVCALVCVCVLCVCVCVQALMTQRSVVSVLEGNALDLRKSLELTQDAVHVEARVKDGIVTKLLEAVRPCACECRRVWVVCQCYVGCMIVVCVLICMVCVCVSVVCVSVCGL